MYLEQTTPPGRSGNTYYCNVQKGYKIQFYDFEYSIKTEVTHH